MTERRIGVGWNYDEQTSHYAPTNTSSKYSYFNFIKKPIEIYVFFDLTCPECWALESYLKKLTLEYGRFFTIKPIISSHSHPLKKNLFKKQGHLRKVRGKKAQTTNLNAKDDFGDFRVEPPDHTSCPASLAIKAAELQGKRAGKRYLRQIQEYLLLNQTVIFDEKTLIECAMKTELDVEEFKKDLYSTSAKKALHGDWQLVKEMDIEDVPAIVFFNQLTNDPGIKISGLYSYDIYVHVLYEILNGKAIPANKPPLEDFLAYYKVVTCSDVSIAYDWSLTKAKREMKKLQLKQVVRKISTDDDSYWKYIEAK